MSICIFPGTFNPIHEAHIKMAKFALKKYNFDKIIFIPSYIPPHKNLDKNLAIHRFNMVKLAIKDYPDFDISDIEYQFEGKSYSVITVKKIIEKYKLTAPLNFIIGTDAFLKTDTWYNAEELKKLVHFIVFPRTGSFDDKMFEIYKKNGWSFDVVDFDRIDISSTEIRNKKIGKTSKNVKEYIENNELYR